MANLADITDDHDFTEEALKRQLTSNPADASLVRRGACLNCGTKILPPLPTAQDPNPKPALYCDSECREDFEETERISKRLRRN